MYHYPQRLLWSLSLFLVISFTYLFLLSLYNVFFCFDLFSLSSFFHSTLCLSHFLSFLFPSKCLDPVSDLNFVYTFELGPDPFLIKSLNRKKICFMGESTCERSFIPELRSPAGGDWPNPVWPSIKDQNLSRIDPSERLVPDSILRKDWFRFRSFWKSKCESYPRKNGSRSEHFKQPDPEPILRRRKLLIQPLEELDLKSFQFGSESGTFLHSFAN